MADNAVPASGGAKIRLFLVETETASDALIRVLNVCVARQVALASVAFEDGPNGGQLRIETPLDDSAAERLSVQLRTLPAVRGVSVGWRSQPE